jgi:hypothetical protein
LRQLFVDLGRFLRLFGWKSGFLTGLHPFPAFLATGAGWLGLLPAGNGVQTGWRTGWLRQVRFVSTQSGGEPAGLDGQNGSTTGKAKATVKKMNRRENLKDRLHNAPSIIC